jgi:hypothetical protein
MNSIVSPFPSPAGITAREPRRFFHGAVLAIGLTALLLPGARAQFSLPWYEPFPAAYTNSGSPVVINSVTYVGKRLNDQAAVWSLGGGGGTGSPTNAGGAELTYTGLGVTAGSVGLWLSPVVTTGNRTRGALLVTTTTNADPAITNTVYCSMLVDVQAAPTTGSRLFAQLSALTTGTASANCLGLWLDTSSNVLISKNSSTVMVANDNGALSPGTHLIVARYNFISAANNDDVVDLWVDPPSSSFEAAESSVPTPNASTTTGGNDLASISSFYIYHPSSGFIPCSLFVDEIRVATNWAQVTPTTLGCASASISTQPTNRTVVEGVSAGFLTIAAGASPTYQWQVSTDSGANWNNATAGSGINSPTYTTPSPIMTDSGNRYRCVVRVSCDNSSVTSSVATLTVSAPVATPTGVLVDDVFNDSDHQNAPVSTSNSVWFASAIGSLDASSGTSMYGFPASATSLLWLGYFTGQTNVPVHLDVWRMLKATLVFTPTGVASGTNNGIRIGLYDYADGGGWRPSMDGTLGGGSGGNAQNVRGYMLGQNFDTTFADDHPQTLYVRNGLTSANLMGTTSDYASLGSGPAGFSFIGAPGFASGTPYTLELTVTRNGPRTARVTANITGGGTNWMTTAVDNTYGYHRFDAIGLRPNNLETTAESFNFTEFKVEVLDVTPTPIPLHIQLAGTNVVVTWTNPANSQFGLQSAAAAAGPYATVANATSPYTNALGSSQQFFRLLAN